MFFHLGQKAKEVVKLGSSSAAAYKRTTVCFDQLLAFLSEFGGCELAGQAVMRPPPLKPTKKRGRPSNDDLINRSALARKSTKSAITRRFSTCKANGETGLGHRTCSQCPFFKKNDPDRSPAPDEQLVATGSTRARNIVNDHVPEAVERIRHKEAI